MKFAEWAETLAGREATESRERRAPGGKGEMQLLKIVIFL